MADSVGIAVMGASGRMGQMLVDTIAASDKAHLMGATERPGHPWIGRDLGEAMGRAPLGVTDALHRRKILARVAQMVGRPLPP